MLIGNSKECNQNNGERANPTSKQRYIFRCSSSSDDEADKQIRSGDKIDVLKAITILSPLLLHVRKSCICVPKDVSLTVL